MNEKVFNIAEIRKKFGMSPKKFRYKLVEGEVKIYNINDLESKYIACSK